MLEVYTHDSLNTKSGAITTDEHGGSSRLAVLGEKVLESAVMTNLFRRRPMNSANQLKVSHLSTGVLIPDLSDVWRVGIDQGLYRQNRRRSMDDWLQPEDQAPVCPGVRCESQEP